MRALVSISALVAAVILSVPGLALPPYEHGRGFRDGANHHLGDDGVAAALDHAPAAIDEPTRMHLHLAHVRDWLAARPATRPELAVRRAELLGYLDDYIAAGVTPENTRLPWRTPVFIDDDGRICAVGYLIERSVGRALAERVAARHRYDFLEDIAAAIPEVASWATASGFSLDELASIQPGYAMPMIEQWTPLAMGDLPDGAFDEESDQGGRARGGLRHGRMQGHWSRLDAHGVEVGKGDFERGAGTWVSSYPDGARLAVGSFAANRPHGLWRFYHASGQLAAEGSFEGGHRHGTWRFFHDTAAKTPIAVGAFARGRVSGRWQHFDAAGKLVATSLERKPPGTESDSMISGHLLDVVPGADGVRHQLYEGFVNGIGRVDALTHHRERLYVLDAQMFDPATSTMYDEDGDHLEKQPSGWQERSCRWSAAFHAAARRGDVLALHHRLSTESESCGEPRALPAGRAARIEALVAPLASVRSPSPEFVRKLVLGEQYPPDPESQAEPDHSADDLVGVLAGHMTWYAEWPHVDGRFIQVFRTLPGYSPTNPQP